MNTILEYIWLDSENKFRSKTRVFYNNIIVSVRDVPRWNYDGSSTNQASTGSSEIVLKPVFICPDPFRLQNHYLVYCATYDIFDKPLSNNHYDTANDTFSEMDEVHYQPWFGMEQEFFICDEDTNVPVNFSYHEKQGKYYCNIDQCPKVERVIMEEFIQNVVHAGLRLSGINAEVAPGQWEFQIGPLCGIKIGHHMMMARYILNRVAHLHHCRINYDPKPFMHLNGSGCHTNFSTVFTRCKNGLKIIYEYIDHLKSVHDECMKSYGDGNKERDDGTSRDGELRCIYK